MDAKMARRAQARDAQFVRLMTAGMLVESTGRGVVGHLESGNADDLTACGKEVAEMPLPQRYLTRTPKVCNRCAKVAGRIEADEVQELANEKMEF